MESTNQSKSVSLAAKIVRYVLGLMFLVFGLNGFFNFLPMPPMEGAMQTYMDGMVASAYFLPLLKICQVLTGVLLLTGMYVPLALSILLPITLNIVLLHAAIDPSGLGMGVFVFVANVFLIWVNKESFKGILTR